MVESITVSTEYSHSDKLRPLSSSNDAICCGNPTNVGTSNTHYITRRLTQLRCHLPRLRLDNWLLLEFDSPKARRQWWRVELLNADWLSQLSIGRIFRFIHSHLDIDFAWNLLASRYCNASGVNAVLPHLTCLRYFAMSSGGSVKVRSHQKRNYFFTRPNPMKSQRTDACGCDRRDIFPGAALGATRCGRRVDSGAFTAARFQRRNFRPELKYINFEAVISQLGPIGSWVPLS